jgi:large subunit ribosomal protein L6
MSRIGKHPVPVPAGVTVELSPHRIAVKGPQGELARTLPDGITATLADGMVTVARASEASRHKALHGLTRTLVANMVKGVSVGFERVLEINGVGYRAELQGNVLQFSLGFSHPVRFPLPEGMKAEVERQNRITLRATDKHLLGLTAARIRNLRPPEPYGGKGIKYAEEVIHRKAGKTAVG